MDVTLLIVVRRLNESQQITYTLSTYNIHMNNIFLPRESGNSPIHERNRQMYFENKNLFRRATILFIFVLEFELYDQLS